MQQDKYPSSVTPIGIQIDQQIIIIIIIIIEAMLVILKITKWWYSNHDI